MSPAGFSVRRPIFTTMVFLIIIILGAISFVRLPIDLMPDITYPTLSVRCTYENASPEEMEELITRPIEEAVSAVPGVDQVTSVSAEGACDIRVTFTWGTDLDAAAGDIRDRLDRVLPRLPDEADRPTLRKYDLASFPILILGAAADLDPIELRQIIDDSIKYRIERIPGVAAVTISGGLDRQIHVNLNAGKIKALGLPLDRIVAQIGAENINQPGGTLDEGLLGVSVRTRGEFNSLDQLRSVVVAVRQGAPIRLGDIATVADSWQRVRRIFKVNGRPGVRLVIYKQSGANTVEAAEAVKKELKRIRRDVPHISLTAIIDTSKYIRQAVTNVGRSALLGGALAVLVILVFLRSFGPTLILATAIPVSIIASFALMYFNGFTLNIMTLGGLALGVGMLVDNAIVVLENIFRLRGGGMDRPQAAVAGAEEVAGAIIASTLTTLTVFLPLIFVRGMAGVMFKQLTFVVGFSLLCSLAAALTLVPMLSARVLSAKATRRRDGFVFSAVSETYLGTLGAALKARWLVVLLALGLLAGTGYLALKVPTELMPAADEGEVRVYAEMEIGTRVEVLEKKFSLIEEIVRREVPEAENTSSFLGGTPWRPSGTHTGSLRISLKPQDQRTRSSMEITAALRRKLSGMPGVTIRTRPGRGLFILRMGFGGDDSLNVEVRGHDLDLAARLAGEVETILESLPGIADARISSTVGAPEALITIDRIRAADLKISVRQVADSIQTVLSGTTAGFYRTGGDEYPIVVKVADADRMAMAELLGLFLTNRDGQPVVLANVVEVRQGRGPVRIQRKDQERVITVSAEVSGRPMSEVAAELRNRIQALPLPRDFQIVLAGDIEEQDEAFGELLTSLLLALALVYMVMACQFESLRYPLVVMFSVPFAAIGVVVMLFLSGTTFNIQSFIGCIMLGGIVVNNAILLVDHTNLLVRRDGLSPDEAIKEAGRRRLRPILMTALTTILGLTPLALGLGEGGETQAPMARAVIGGLISATLITLVLVPTIYSLFTGRKKKEDAEQTPPSEKAASGGPAVDLESR